MEDVDKILQELIDGETEVTLHLVDGTRRTGQIVKVYERSIMLATERHGRDIRNVVRMDAIIAIEYEEPEHVIEKKYRRKEKIEPIEPVREAPREKHRVRIAKAEKAPTTAPEQVAPVQPKKVAAEAARQPAQEQKKKKEEETKIVDQEKAAQAAK